MEQNPKRFSFDATLDDLVDSQTRAFATSDTLRRARENSVFWGGLVSGAVLFMAWGFNVEPGSLPQTIVGAALAVGVGVVCGLLYRLWYDRTRLHQIRGVARERLAGAESLHYEIELRPDVVWLRQGGVEVALRWNEASGVHDTGDAIELRFKGGGLVVAPNRMFSADADRERFLEQARDSLRI